MALSPRAPLRDLLAKGAKDVPVKATYMGKRSATLLVFSDIIVGNRSLTHLHIPVDKVDAAELAQLQPGDRVLLTGTPYEYTSAMHPEGGVSIGDVHVVKRLNHTRRKLVRSV